MNSNKKPLLFIIVPLIIGVVWIITFLVLIATGVIASVPALDTIHMSSAMKADVLRHEEASKLWATVVFAGFPIFFIGGAISIIVGASQIAKQKRKR